ncbi:MAG: hypothetical protein ACYDHG_18260 [Desulfomonilaceae bacterium]
MALNNMGIHGQEGCSSTNEQQNECGSRVGNSGVSSQMLEQSADLLVSMRDLIPILKEVLDMREAEFSDKITQQISDKYDAMIGSMEQRLKDQITETGQADLKSALMGSVEEAVEDFMRNMLASGGSYERDMRTFVSRIVDERFTGELGSLLGTIDIFPKSKTGLDEAGTGRKSARLSATIRQETYDQIKSLGGVFSNHIQAACELYLKALDGIQNDTRTGQ